MRAVSILVLTALMSMLVCGCSARGGISKSRTGGGISTPIGGVSGAIRY